MPDRLGLLRRATRTSHCIPLQRCSGKCGAEGACRSGGKRTDRDDRCNASCWQRQWEPWRWCETSGALHRRCHRAGSCACCKRTGDPDGRGCQPVRRGQRRSRDRRHSAESRRRIPGECSRSITCRRCAAGVSSAKRWRRRTGPPSGGVPGRKRCNLVQSHACPPRVCLLRRKLMPWCTCGPKHVQGASAAASRPGRAHGATRRVAAATSPRPRRWGCGAAQHGRRAPVRARRLPCEKALQRVLRFSRAARPTQGPRACQGGRGPNLAAVRRPAWTALRRAAACGCAKSRATSETPTPKGWASRRGCRRAPSRADAALAGDAG